MNKFQKMMNKIADYLDSPQGDWVIAVVFLSIAFTFGVLVS